MDTPPSTATNYLCCGLTLQSPPHPCHVICCLLELPSWARALVAGCKAISSIVLLCRAPGMAQQRAQITRNCPGRAAAGPPGAAARPGRSARPWGPLSLARLTAGGWQAYLCTTGVLRLVSDLQMLSCQENRESVRLTACWAAPIHLNCFHLHAGKPETMLYKEGLNVAEY